MKARLSALVGKIADAQLGNVALRCRFEKLNSDWQCTMTAVDDGVVQVHAALVRLQSARLALSELVLWLQSVEATVREGSSKTPSSLADLQCEHEKYRVLVLPHFFQFWPNLIFVLHL